MATIVAFLLSNHYILPALGCLATAVVIYFKGRNSGLESARKKNQEAMDRIESDLRQREAQNQNIETQRDKDAETIRTTNSIPLLISLFDKLFNKKAPGSDAPKKNP